MQKHSMQQWHDSTRLMEPDHPQNRDKLQQFQSEVIRMGYPTENTADFESIVDVVGAIKLPCMFSATYYPTLHLNHTTFDQDLHK